MYIEKEKPTYIYVFVYLVSNGYTSMYTFASLCVLSPPGKFSVIYVYGGYVTCFTISSKFGIVFFFMLVVHNDSPRENTLHIWQ